MKRKYEPKNNNNNNNNNNKGGTTKAQYAGASAPYDPDFDYFATQLKTEVLEKLKRPALEKPLDLSQELFFEVLHVKSNYVKGESHPLAEWPGSGQIPVVRVYGCLPTGQSVCVNVWNFAPYLFINAPEAVKKAKRQPTPEQVALQLQEALEKIIRKKEKRKGSSSYDNRNERESNVTNDIYKPIAPLRRSPFETPARSRSTRNVEEEFAGHYEDDDPEEVTGRGLVGGLDRLGDESSDEEPEDFDKEDADDGGNSTKKKKNKTSTKSNAIAAPPLPNPNKGLDPEPNEVVITRDAISDDDDDDEGDAMDEDFYHPINTSKSVNDIPEDVLMPDAPESYLATATTTVIEQSEFYMDQDLGDMMGVGYDNTFQPLGRVRGDRGAYQKGNQGQQRAPGDDGRGPRVIAVVPEQYKIADHFQVDKRLVFAVYLRTPNMVTTVRNLIGDGDNDRVKLAKDLYVRGPTCESGVRFENRFMLDRHIVGKGWAGLKGGTYQVRKPLAHDTTCSIEIDVDANDIIGYSTKEKPDLYALPSKMRVMSFDIECLPKSGFPDPKIDPVINIRLVGFEMGNPEAINMDIGLFLGSCNRDDVGRLGNLVCFENERDLLNAVGQLGRIYDFDIGTGYNISNFDLRYLIERAKVIGANDLLDLTRLKGDQLEGKVEERKSKNQGNSERYTTSCTGRVFIDMYYYVMNNMYKKLRSYKLNDVASEILGDQKEDVSYKQIPHLYYGTLEGEPVDKLPSDPDEIAKRIERGRAGRARIDAYCRKDAILPMNLMNKLSALISLIELSRVQRVQLDQQQNGGASFKVFAQLLYKMRSRGFIVPYKSNHVRVDYQGATVFEPVRGYYHESPTAVLDFSSLYPSLAIAHNLCYTTLVRERDVPRIMEHFGFGDEWHAAVAQGDKQRVKAIENEVIYTCPIGNRYVRARYFEGVFPAMEKELLACRGEAKGLIKFAITLLEKNVASSREIAFKLAANSGYGFHGLISNGVYWYQVAASITACGRAQILLTKDTIESEFTIANGCPGDAKVIYGDTDSVMVVFGIPPADPKNPKGKEEVLERCITLAKAAAARCTSLFDRPNELAFENIFWPYLLINKKRYGAQIWLNPQTPNPTLKIRGLESVRRDNCRLMADTQKRCLELILKKGEPERALKFTQSQIRRLLEGKVDLHELIVSGALSKYQKDYKVKQSHAEVRELMEKRNPGSGPKIGDRVPYVLVDRGGKDKGKFMVKRYMCAEDPIYALEHDLPINTRYYMQKQMLKPLIRVFKPIYPDAESLISTGEHTRHLDRHITLNPDQGLGRFFSKKNPMCAACGVTITTSAMVADERCAGNLICASCEAAGKRLAVTQEAIRELRNTQTAYSRVWTNCQDCQGSRFKEVICSAQGCPVFFKRIRLKRDLTEQRKRVDALGLTNPDATDLTSLPDLF